MRTGTEPKGVSKLYHKNLTFPFVDTAFSYRNSFIVYKRQNGTHQLCTVASSRMCISHLRILSQQMSTEFWKVLLELSSQNIYKLLSQTFLLNFSTNLHFDAALYDQNINVNSRTVEPLVVWKLRAYTVFIYVQAFKRSWGSTKTSDVETKLWNLCDFSVICVPHSLL